MELRPRNPDVEYTHDGVDVEDVGEDTDDDVHVEITKKEKVSKYTNREELGRVDQETVGSQKPFDELRGEDRWVGRRVRKNFGKEHGDFDGIILLGIFFITMLLHLCLFV